MSEFREDRDALRTMIRRVQLSQLDDSGSQQKVAVSGLKGDQPKDVVRIQSFGLSSTPPAGAEGLALALGGRSDRLTVLGLEHADYRPRDIAAGGTVLYDASQQSISLVEGVLRVVAVDRLELVCGAASIVIAGGKITVTASAIDFKQA